MDKIIAFAKSKHAHLDDGHGFDHIFRVYRLAENILADYPEANRELVLTAALLHDTYDEKLVTNVAKTKQEVADFLVAINFAYPEQLFEIIDHLSFSESLDNPQYTLDINGQIVQDADRLDAIGAFGIVRTLQYGFAHNRELYHPDYPPQTFTSKTDYHAAKGTTINHFYEKLFQISETLHTQKAKQLAIEREHTMRVFVHAIEKEWADVYKH